MLREVDDVIFEQAIERWGEAAQMVKAIEEMAELTAIIARDMNEVTPPADIVDELADVTIMIRQLVLIHGQSQVRERIKYKMKRLRTMLGVDAGGHMLPKKNKGKKP